LTCAEAVDVFGERKAKGEFTLVLSAVARGTPDIGSGIEAVLDAMARGQSMTAAVRVVAADLGLSRRKLYEAMLARSRDTTTER
jgi:16S rRNA C1402 (ribose-2'-O) methylase RsmI